jgi:hypothetical protein
MKPFNKHRSDDWVSGALLASVLAAAAGLHGAWLREVALARAVAQAPAASASQTTVVAAAARHVEAR